MFRIVLPDLPKRAAALGWMLLDAEGRTAWTLDAEVALVTSVQTTGRWLVSATGWQDAARVGDARCHRGGPRRGPRDLRLHGGGLRAQD